MANIPVKQTPISQRTIKAVHLKQQTMLGQFGSYTSSVSATDLVTISFAPMGVCISKLGADTVVPFGSILSIILDIETPEAK